MYYLPVGKGDHFTADNRDYWASQVARTQHRLKAPVSWVEAQGLKGRPPIAAYSIWAKYPLDRQLSIWLMSSDEDFRRAGYIR